MRPALLAGLAACVVTAAHAADPSPAVPATVLTLTARGSVAAPPDLLGATLHATATTATAATASAAVNRAIEAARHAASAMPAVRFIATAYQVTQNAAPDSRWQAQQTVTLTASDSDALLRLVAVLQHQNMVTDDISWQLGAEAAAALHQQAVQLALKSLRDQAAADAGTLGLKVGHFGAITVDDDSPVATPMRARMMTAAAPTADRPDDARVEATVHADVSLSP